MEKWGDAFVELRKNIVEKRWGGGGENGDKRGEIKLGVEKVWITVCFCEHVIQMLLT